MCGDDEGLAYQVTRPGILAIEVAFDPAMGDVDIRPRGVSVASANVKKSFASVLCMKVKYYCTNMTQSNRLMYDLAERRAGYFSTAQAQAAGISRQLLRYHVRQGNLEHAARGVYRLRLFPGQPFEDVVIACLWAGDDAVASHDTALAIYDLSEAMPATIHITLPHPFRGRRSGVRIHSAPLPARDCTTRDGVPVTTVERTLGDVAVGSEPGTAEAAVREALARGLVSRRRLERRASAAPPLRQALANALGSGA